MRRGAFRAATWPRRLEDALALAGQDQAPEAFLIGGAQLYVEGLRLADKLIVTEISADFEGDVTFPASMTPSGKKSRRNDRADAPNDFDYAFVTCSASAPENAALASCRYSVTA